MFNPNSVKYLSTTPNQRRTPQRTEGFVAMSERGATEARRSSRSTAAPAAASPAPPPPPAASAPRREERSRYLATNPPTTSRTTETGNRGSHFMKTGLHNLQTYFNVVLGNSTGDQYSHEVQRRRWAHENNTYSQMDRNPAPMFDSPNTSSHGAVYPLNGASPAHTASRSRSTPESGAVSESGHRRHHRHRARQHTQGLAENAQTTDADSATRGVPAAVMVRAVRHMRLHVIRVPASSPDELAEATFAEQATPVAETPSECARQIIEENGLDSVCMDLWEKSVVQSGRPVPSVDPSTADPSSLVQRYFIYECDRDGCLTHIELTNFKGCSVCLKKFKEGEEVGELPCRHLYHLSCIHRWLRLKDTCPNCRLTISAALFASPDVPVAATTAEHQQWHCH